MMRSETVTLCINATYCSAGDLTPAVAPTKPVSAPSDASFEAANEAIQIHGAYGYSDEYDVERYLRNARGAIIYEGTSEIHQLMQAGYTLGYRTDGALRCELPAYNEQVWRS